MANCSTFSIAHTDLTSQPFNNAQRTVRILVPNNLHGKGLRIKFSNYYGKDPVWVGNASIALSDNRGELIEGSVMPLTVHGDSSFAIVPRRDVYSDYIEIALHPGQVLAVSLYYPSENKVVSGNLIGNFAMRSVRGDYCRETKLPQAILWTKLSHSLMPWDVSSPVTTLSGVVIDVNKDYPTPRVIAAFGDSIMQQGAWTTPFMARLYKRYPGEVSFCNLGIGGNRLLHPSPTMIKGLFGNSGLERFSYDLLPIEGLTHVIFALGTNDLGLPGRDGAKSEELITLQEYIDAVTGLSQELRERKIKLFVGTLLPREIDIVYSKAREELRIAINEWILSCGLFDGTIDIAASVADEDGVGMCREYSQPDGLHPNILGGKIIAESIDLDMFSK